MLFQVAVDAVIAGVELASDKPLPEGGMAGIERGVPIVIPVQKLRIFVETLGEMLLAEFFDHGGIGEVFLARALGTVVTPLEKSAYSMTTGRGTARAGSCALKLARSLRRCGDSQ